MSVLALKKNKNNDIICRPKTKGQLKKFCEPNIGSSLQSAFARSTRSSQRGSETVGSIKSLLKKKKNLLFVLL